MLDDARAAGSTRDARDPSAAPSSSTATACSTGRSCATACRVPPRDARASFELLPASPRRARALRDAGLRAGRGHQPARHRPRHARPAPSVERDARRAARSELPLDDDRGLPARRRRRLRVPQAAARDDPRRRRAGSASTWTAASCVGDRWRDIEAAQRAGVRAVYVDRRLRRAARADAPDARRGQLCPRHVILSSSRYDADGDRRRDRRRRPASTREDLRRRRRPREHRRPRRATRRSPGFTTNPTLMRKAGIDDYEAFARKVLETITDRPDLVRGLRRRAGRDGPPGPADRLLGRRTSTSRSRSPTPRATPTDAVIARARRRRRPAQRHRADDGRPGRDGGRGARRAARGASSRSSPAASPTPAATRCRS